MDKVDSVNTSYLIVRGIELYRLFLCVPITTQPNLDEKLAVLNAV